MSAICGIVGGPGEILGEQDLVPVMNALRHRGPHGQSTWDGGRVALGHLLLRTTPQSGYERLPWRHPESGKVITADARIDNRDDLFAALGMRSDEAVPDGQLILQAFLQWGERCVERLEGDFAFAIWDPGSGTLFCARDHLGLKPFVYGICKRNFYFASSAVAVACAPGFAAQLNEARVADYLIQESSGIDPAVTFFEGVYRLPPGTKAVFREGNLRIQEWWNPRLEAVDAAWRDTEYEERFKVSFQRAVSRCLTSAKPVASMLSGGIDSSAVVGIANELHASGRTKGQGFLAATLSQIGDRNATDSDSVCIRAVGRHCGVPAILLDSATVDEYESHLDQLFADLEDPADGKSLQRNVVYLAARANGFRVVLDGVDGDMSISLPTGYPAFLAAAGNWRHAFLEAFGQWRNYYDRRVPLWRPFANAFWPVITTASYREKRRLGAQQRQLGEHMAARLIRPEFAAAVDLNARFHRYRLTLHSGSLDRLGSDGLKAAHLARVRMPYLTDGIERFERAAAVVGAEARHPLLDRQFVELCLSMPWNQLCRRGWAKFALRRLAAGVLPARVAWRRDSGGLDWQLRRRWFEKKREIIRERILGDRDRFAEWIDNAKLTALVNDKSMEYDSFEWYYLWRLFLLSVWLRRQRL